MFITFVRNNWQALAIAAIVGFLYIRGSIIKSERDEALATINAMQEAAFKRDVEVTLLTERGKRAVEALTQSHDEQIAQLLEAKANDKKTISNLRGNLSNSLRDKADNYHSIMSNDDTNQSASTDIDTDSDRTYKDADTDYRVMYLGAQSYIETLEQAGAIAAADYNLCRDYVIGEQSRIGVSETGYK